MRIRILLFFSLTMLLTLGMITTNLKEQGQTLDNLTTSMETMQDTLFNLTSNEFSYTNPYATNFTINDFIYNTIHGAMYSIFVEVNTMFGISIKWFYNNVEFTQMKFIFKIIIYLGIAWILSKSVIPIGAIYVFYEDIFEKKKKKIKKYWIMLFAILTWVLILGLIALLFVFW